MSTPEKVITHTDATADLKSHWQPEPTPYLWRVIILLTFIVVQFALAGWALAKERATAELRCMPKPWGTAVGQQLRTNGHGLYAWWWCSDGFEWWLQEAALTWGAVRSSFNVRVFDEVTRSKDPLAAMQPWLAQAGKWEDPALRAVWEPHVAERSKAAPPASIWIVAPNAGRPTRPLFSLLPDGKRGPQLGHVPVQASGAPVPCDMSTRSVEGRSTFGVPLVPGTPQLGLTLCSRR